VIEIGDEPCVMNAWKPKEEEDCDWSTKCVC